MSVPTLRRRTISRELPAQDMPERHEDFSTHQITLPRSRRRSTVIKAIVILFLTLPITYLLRQKISLALRLPVLLVWKILHSLISGLAELLHILTHRLHSLICTKKDELRSVCRHFSDGAHDHGRKMFLFLAMLLVVLPAIMMLVRMWRRKNDDEESGNCTKTTTNKSWWKVRGREERKKLR